MIRILVALCALVVLAAPAAADDASSGDDASGESTDSNSIYRKKVGGILWLEGTAGPTRYVPNKLVNNLGLTDGFDIEAPDITVTGPEFGGAIGFSLGTFNIGARIKSANYDTFKLNTASLDMGWTIGIPYVQPYIRLGINYHWIKGDSSALLPAVPGGTFDLKANGGGLTTGLGIRVPVIKWISIAMGVDFTMVGVYIRGSGTANIGGMTISAEAQGGALGFQTSGTFALTFHI